MVWAALIIGLGCGVLFLGSGLVVRFGEIWERLRRLGGSPRRPDPAEARALAERLGAFDALREELLLRAMRAKADTDLGAELDAFREASDRFLQLVGHELREVEPPPR